MNQEFENKKEIKTPSRMKKIGFGALIAISVVGLPAGLSWFNEPTFSETTKEISGATSFWDAAQWVENSERLNKQDVVNEIRKMNPDIDPGEITTSTEITIPAGVSINKLDQTAQNIDSVAQTNESEKD